MSKLPCLADRVEVVLVCVNLLGDVLLDVVVLGGILLVQMVEEEEKVPHLVLVFDVVPGKL